MKVLVAGSNGHTGRLIIQQLTEKQPHQSFAMVRTEEQSGTLIDLGADKTIFGDLELKEDMKRVVKGMDAVLFVAGSGSDTGSDKTIAVDQEGAKNLIDAASEEGIQHFVMLSAMGVDEPGDSSIAHYRKAKKEADEYLRQSGLTYTIVRPGRLSFDEGTGRIELKEKIESSDGRSIPREDVAHVMIAALDIFNVHNVTFDILSGEDEIEEAMKAFP